MRAASRADANEPPRGSWLRRVRGFLADRRGSGDLTVYMLLTAAGAAMVGLTLPSLFASSNSAARTFKTQAGVLERGAGGGSSGASGDTSSGSSWTISVGSNGVSASGSYGGVSGQVSSGSHGDGVSVSASGGSGGATSGGVSGHQQSAGGGTAPLIGGAGINAAAAQQALVNARVE